MKKPTNEEVIRAFSGAPQSLLDGFGDEGDLTRQHLLNPAIFSLLGDVQDKTILDAGCSQGYLSRLLARRGARVTGVEPAEVFFSYALRREQAEGLGISYLQADLSRWSPPPDEYDVVVANMVFMDIPDYEAALHTCVKALKPGGGLFFSILHPCFEERGVAWKEKGYVEVRDYFEERSVRQDYGFFIHRPLSTYLNSVIDAGCILKRVLEPQLQRELAERYDAERYGSVPGYLIVFATKHIPTL